MLVRRKSVNSQCRNYQETTRPRQSSPGPSLFSDRFDMRVNRCRANMAHIRQSRPDYAFGYEVKVHKTYPGVTSSLGSGAGSESSSGSLTSVSLNERRKNLLRTCVLIRSFRHTICNTSTVFHSVEAFESQSPSNKEEEETSGSGSPAVASDPPQSPTPVSGRGRAVPAPPPPLPPASHHDLSQHPRRWTGVRGQGLQGYLAHKKSRFPMTLQ